ncbi:MAG TPA: hypothetical protein DCZ94_20750 [Lentisphaeria bacterium]|nr:MAG: hypothetical protein A2X48_09100 [Lentisphaerae bacterium GWF2_49_21]HBC89377.1 hypothetical protein [Lentisphaeria bacterium]
MLKKMMVSLLGLLFALSLAAGVQVKDENGNDKITKNEKKDQKKEEKKKEEKKEANNPEMVKKLQAIIVARADFQKISVVSAVKQLNELAVLNDPEKKGISFSMDANDQLSGGEATITFTKENVNLEMILNVVCKQGGYTYLASAEGVKLSRPDSGKKKDKDKTKL